MRLNGRGSYKLGGQCPPDAVSLLPDASVLPFEAQLEAVVLTQLLAAGTDAVIGLQGPVAGHAATNVRQSPVGG